MSICNRNLGDFWPHRRDFKEGQIDPPSRIGLLTDLSDRLTIGVLYFNQAYKGMYGYT